MADETENNGGWGNPDSYETSGSMQQTVLDPKKEAEDINSMPPPVSVTQTEWCMPGVVVSIGGEDAVITKVHADQSCDVRYIAGSQKGETATSIDADMLVRFVLLLLLL